jgi:hypothetical protein
MAQDVDEQEDDVFEARPTIGQRITQALAPKAPKAPATPEPTLDEPLDDAGRRAYIRSVSATERRWVNIALYLALFGGIIITGYVASGHGTTTQTLKLTGGLPWSVGTHTQKVSISQSWIILGVIVVVLAGIGLAALRYQKRSLVTFSLLLLGLSFTPFFQPFGLAILFVGGWMLLRAYRVQKHGVPSGKAAARASAQKRAERRSGTTSSKSTSRAPAAKAASRSTARKPAAQSGDRRTPTASKRYTPKAAPKKKVVKPT